MIGAVQKSNAVRTVLCRVRRISFVGRESWVVTRESFVIPLSGLGTQEQEYLIFLAGYSFFACSGVVRWDRSVVLLRSEKFKWTS